MKTILVWIGIIALVVVFSGNKSENEAVEAANTYEMPTENPSPTVDYTEKAREFINNNPPSDYNLQFNGYDCTEDCSGHEAGYEWAEENGIEDEDDCGRNSDSFIEGCQSYVQDNYSDDYDDEYSDY